MNWPPVARRPASLQRDLGRIRIRSGGGSHAEESAQAFSSVFHDEIDDRHEEEGDEGGEEDAEAE